MTEKEVYDAPKSMKNDKTPANGGLLTLWLLRVPAGPQSICFLFLFFIFPIFLQRVAPMKIPHFRGLFYPSVWFNFPMPRK